MSLLVDEKFGESGVGELANGAGGRGGSRIGPVAEVAWCPRTVGEGATDGDSVRRGDEAADVVPSLVGRHDYRSAANRHLKRLTETAAKTDSENVSDKVQVQLAD
nr:hypothetical protein [Halogeometricum rufum]